MEIRECIARLTGKDAESARAFADEIAAESREDSRWAGYMGEFTALLGNKNSFVRNRAISILAANAPWAGAQAAKAALDGLLPHLMDEKPITVRQCVKALPDFAAAHPELAGRIRQALEAMDLSRYGDSMRPLISKDILTALGRLP